MCVIIVRQPGITLPFDKLKTACKVNNHGWGLAVVDRGKIELHRELQPNGNDPEVIAEALDDAKDQLLLLHLRFVTAGDKHVKNCHPFPVLSQDQDGSDIVLAHNGTLYMYRDPNDGMSDTSHFVTDFAQPLLARAIRFAGPEHVLSDPFVNKLLKKEINSSSVVTFVDSFGNVLNINEDNGAKFDGWWASNTYSFQSDHRESTTTHYCNFGGSYSSYTDADYGDDDQYSLQGTTPSSSKDDWKQPAWWDQTDKAAASGSKSATIILPKQELDKDIDFIDYEEDAKRIKTALDMTEKTPSQVLIKHLLDQKRPTFCQLTGIDNLKEMVRFDPEDLAEFISFYPEISVTLLQDLLYELYLKDHKPIINTVVNITKHVAANANATSPDVQAVTS